MFASGKLRPALKEELAAEGLVLLEEGLRCSVRYTNFRAPGKRFHNKRTGERVGLGISQKRLVLYCRWGRAKLIDTEFTNPRLHAMQISAAGEELTFTIDYAKLDEPSVSGVIRIVVRTPDAVSIAEAIRSRTA